MSFDIETVNKQNFICLKFDDGQIYFGEVAYLNEQGQIVDVSNTEITEEEKTKLEKIRHGAGVQLFSQGDQEGFVSKYEGYWNLDRKHGEAKCVFPDTSIYHGKFTFDVFDGFGQYSWANGDIYEGNWKMGRLEGLGKFVHRDGHTLEGLFKNNYFQHESELYINPFLDENGMNEYILLRKDIDKQKERNDNLKQFKFEKLMDYTNVEEFIKKSIDKNRIPMILSSKELNLTKNEFITKLKEKTQKNIFEFNLRDIMIEKKTKGTCKDYLSKIKDALSNVITKGEIFLINLDETEQPYEEIYDPDMREFYSATSFPSQIWNVNLLKRQEVYEKILAGTTNKPHSKISSNFSIIVWSKFRIDQQFDNQKIMEKFERRFSSIIPTQKIDLILMCFEEKKVVEAPAKKRPVSKKKKKK